MVSTLCRDINCFGVAAFSMAYCPLSWSLECFDVHIILAFHPSFLSALGENLPIVLLNAPGDY